MKTTKVVCPCCAGNGKDQWFNLPKCIVCHGLGHFDIEIKGDVTKLMHLDYTIPLEEFEADIEMTKDIFEWIKTEYETEGWWKNHARIPILEDLERILLDAEEITLDDIPGGPTNPTHPEMVTKAKELEQAMLKLVEEARKSNIGVEESMSKAYNSYRGNLRPTSEQELMRQKLVAAQAASAKKVLGLDIETTNPPAEPDLTTEEIPMSTSNITDRLKTGGKTVLEAAKEGALLGTVTAANKGAVDILELKLGDKYPEILKTEAGRTAMQLAIPALLLMICEMDEGNRIPAKEQVQLAAELAVKGTSADAMEAAMSFLLQNGFMLLSVYAQAGKEAEASTTAAAIGEDVITAQNEMDTMRVRERARAVEAEVVVPNFE